jgi:hypothetical protein
MLVGVVAIARGYASSCQNKLSELFSDLLPEIAQGLPKTFIPLLHAPQFERIGELIDFGDLDPFAPDVVQSTTCRQKVVDAHEHLELLFRRG